MLNSPAHVEISVLRPDDLLNLEIVAVNLRLDTTNAENPVLVVDDSAQPALLVVGFPSQTIFEEAFFDSSAPSPKTPEQDPSPAPAHKPIPPDPNPDNGPKTPSDPGSVQFRLGGESRLVFKVPADARIPYTVAGLLDWSTFELAVSPIADVPNGATPNTSLPIKEPEATETTLQLPFRLHLSPAHDAAWQHDPNLVNHAGRVELWHTRLATRDANGEAQQLSADNQIGLRAIWSPDYKPGGPVPSPGNSPFDGGATAGFRDDPYRRWGVSSSSTSSTAASSPSSPQVSRAPGSPSASASGSPSPSASAPTMTRQTDVVDFKVLGSGYPSIQYGTDSTTTQSKGGYGPLGNGVALPWLTQPQDRELLAGKRPRERRLCHCPGRIRRRQHRQRPAG